MSGLDAVGLIRKYIAVWNEPEAEARALAAVELWAPDGTVVNSRFEYRGHARVIEAVHRSYEHFVARGFRYRARPESAAHHQGVCVLWQMLDPEGTVDSCGTNFLLLNTAGEIRLDYQFVAA